MNSIYKLKLRYDDQQETIVECTKTRMTIGRSSRNDIVLGDPFASRFHAEIRFEKEEALLVDNGSANGSFLNGEIISEPVVLKPGNIIRIGKTEIKCIIEKPSGIEVPAVHLTGVLNELLPEGTITTSIGRHSPYEILSQIGSSRGDNSVAEQSHKTAEEIAVGETKFAVPIGESRDMLRIVSKVGIALLPHTSLEDTLRMVIDLVFDAIPAERGLLFLREGDELQCRIAIDSNHNPLESSSQVRISRSITKKVLDEHASILTSDAEHDPRFQGQESIILSQLRSVMAVPFVSGEATLGMIYVDNPFHSRFTEEDLDILTTIASVASIKIEHQKLLEAKIAKERIEQELKVASEIQTKLQPVTPPHLKGWDITGVSFPCREIGGDYYDFIPHKKDAGIIISLGDVTGKGIGAALLMSSVHAAIRTQSQLGITITQIMGEINQYIYDNTPTNKFVTLFFSILDTETGVLKYCNCGHNLPLLVRSSGDINRLKVGGTPIGIMPDFPYVEGEEIIEPGDVLLIYSDGVTESINSEGIEFGEERLIEVVQKNSTRSARGIFDRLDEALSRFVGTTPAVDDMTVVIIKRDYGLGNAKPPLTDGSY
ncbi:MAG: hypothetical protein A2Y62_05360 [Candidatus Fischerbacteria bacterium RBG_13_37_8]|uniref:FHA domain-containing protein n=1 Tax=Candidatus Fischerbacteria bacterium RBG_13_37_8 TaxID=1817863 RepID=A0A1F5VXS6_9BACT|nr:MAG: hypothetical protein A2Y62_05360 [Candidatus Fischerbacteria bacterium RBG_13_37_8]